MKQIHISDGAEFCFFLPLFGSCSNCFEFCLIYLRAKIVNGNSRDFSVHRENGIEYLIESNCLRQEKEEIVALKIFFYSRAIKNLKINEAEWQVSEPVGHKPLWPLIDSVYMTAGLLIDR